VNVTKTVFALASFAFATMPVASGAADQARRPVFSPDPYHYLLGHWVGEGRFERSGKPLQSTLEVSIASRGEALELREEERPPNTFTYVGLLTLDSAGRLVMLMAGSNGGGARLFNAVENTPTRLVLQSEPQLRAWFGLERITLDERDADHLAATYEISSDNGASWRVGDRQIYSRS
jgi:hypothetical protein